MESKSFESAGRKDFADLVSEHIGEINFTQLPGDEHMFVAGRGKLMLTIFQILPRPLYARKFALNLLRFELFVRELTGDEMAALTGYLLEVWEKQAVNGLRLFNAFFDEPDKIAVQIKGLSAEEVRQILRFLKNHDQFGITRLDIAA